jgi:transcription termination factor NusB
MGTYEICYAEDVPNSVAISEIIRLCKDYADEDSYAYINAVLAKVEREVAKEDTEESGASQ